MAKSTRQYVFEGMELLPTALIPFVEKRLESSLKGHWQVQVLEKVPTLRPNSDGKVDWDQAARLGMQAVNQPYSGHFGFANTRMYWPTTHMVASREKALQCVECHAEHGQGRLDWIALGYAGDPIHYGSRPARSERGQK